MKEFPKLEHDNLGKGELIHSSAVGIRIRVCKGLPPNQARI